MKQKKLQVIYADPPTETLFGQPVIGHTVHEDGSSLAMIAMSEEYERNWNANAMKQNARYLSDEGIDPTEENLRFLCDSIMQNVATIGTPDIAGILNALRGKAVTA